MFFQKSHYTEMLIEKNALDQIGLKKWIFCNGMLFKSPDKWWGDHGQRDFPHEGIDFCLYRDHAGEIGRIDEKTQIPVLHDGMIKAIFKDYLGYALVVEHNISLNDNGGLVSFYAHTKPDANMDIGMAVNKGDIIGTIADTRHSKANILPHLHFSLWYASKPISYDGFIWNTIRNPEIITLLDPLPIIDWPYQLMEADDSPCREI